VRPAAAPRRTDAGTGCPGDPAGVCCERRAARPARRPAGGDGCTRTGAPCGGTATGGWWRCRPLGAVPTLRAAGACFEALRVAAVARAEGVSSDEDPDDLRPGSPGPPTPGNVVDLAESRRTRRR